MTLLTTTIGAKLASAEKICLITDNWSDPQMRSFIALATNIVYADFNRDTIVVGMMNMPGEHRAENIQECVQRLINKYDFDKSKCVGIY